MAERLLIDPQSILDNVGDRQVEFTARGDGEPYQFAVRYDVLEALSGSVPDTDAPALFRQHQAAIEAMAPRALSRADGTDLVVITENDMG
ncbi:MAG TPA: DUF1488 family protein [Sphingomonas sp.]|jgi:hypothetical protein